MVGLAEQVISEILYRYRWNYPNVVQKMIGEDGPIGNIFAYDYKIDNGTVICDVTAVPVN